MELWKLILLIGLSGLVSACETVVHGTQQDVVIETDPAGANVLLSDGQRCTSPCHVTVARYQVLTASVSHIDCQKANGQLVPAVIDGATIMGSIFDYQLGGIYDLEPNPLHITLVCGAETRQALSGPTAEDMALLQALGRPIKTIGMPSIAPEEPR